ncbi:nodulation protein NolB [Mesorhizobium sp. VK25A]|uniref:Nodulation protein NolB n=1 Tax=Mesorhizobium vachelliae TaxID=3072309 RepID=A0ABU5ABG4_9HYPH|nr:MULTISPECIES: nodulation protein NolB [unclassified Mesorhizobium]MDX8443983.1 nodulation protein NolB [Mesorhizobium sp. VK3C]MDX8509905.1 nodulation protein NolB [Mesorhizobium sp. VK22E]MDX8533874.1 nodulation protein NolB [Mesorhizobium sp. VK25D]MDX8546655.1 nodulation protein NolB [Mesorhizobium sp. VK25A]
MTTGVTSISANFADNLSRVGPTSACGEQAQFECALVEAVASIKNDGPSATAGAGAGPVAPVLEVPRATSETSPLGDRVLQTLSSLYRDNAVAPATPDQEVPLVKDVLLGPVEQSPSQAGSGMRMSGAPPGRENYEAMIAGLREVYSAVTEVSLVTKSISGATSSVNTLIKQG